MSFFMHWTDNQTLCRTDKDWRLLSSMEKIYRPTFTFAIPENHDWTESQIQHYIKQEFKQIPIVLSSLIQTYIPFTLKRKYFHRMITPICDGIRVAQETIRGTNSYSSFDALSGYSSFNAWHAAKLEELYLTALILQYNPSWNRFMSQDNHYYESVYHRQNEMDAMKVTEREMQWFVDTNFPWYPRYMQEYDRLIQDVSFDEEIQRDCNESEEKADEEEIERQLSLLSGYVPNEDVMDSVPNASFIQIVECSTILMQDIF